MMLLALAMIGGATESVNAQGWLKKLGKKVEDAARRKIEQKAEQKTEKAVDDLFEGKITTGKKDKDDSDDDDNGNASAQTGGKKTPKSLEATYAKSDFVPGDEIIFEDNLTGEQLGEFPSKWDLERGTAEIAKVGGENAIAMIGDSWIKPLMANNSTNYLGDVFTVEYDLLQDRSNNSGTGMEIDFMPPNVTRDREIYTMSYNTWYEKPTVTMQYVKTGEADNTRTEGSASAQEVLLSDGQWHHFAISFNKRALKVYVDGTRIINIPNAKAGAGWMTFWRGSGGENPTYIKNVRIAKGAVPLYDRMMSEGKFITYGITFDVGKSTIKPESMGEINRIVQLMKDNPNLKFSVEGHTDNTGSAAGNQTLSEARSQAIVAKLVEMGIAQSRLTAVGKGQNSPIADNGTDEGRAKNRRVEFVKQ